jgi:hypothetical protein
MKATVTQVGIVPNFRPVHPRRLRELWLRWQPERSELLIRLRPRAQEVRHVAR